MIDVIVSALLPVILTLALGAVAGWDGDEKSAAVGSLNTMVLRYALPASLFAGTMTTPAETLIRDGRLVLLLTLAMMVPFAIVLFVSRVLVKRDLSTSTLQALAVASPAIPFVGLPILSPLIGSTTAVVVATGGVISSAVQMPIGLALMGADQHRKSAASSSSGAAKAGSPSPSMGQTILKAVLQPVVIAPLLALVLVFVRVPIPAMILDSLKLLGVTVGGVALFAAGVVLQAHKPTLSLPVSWSIGGHLVLPFLILALATALGASSALTSSVVLPMALPGAAMVLILAVHFQVAEREAATFLLASYILSLPALAILKLLLG